MSQDEQIQVTLESGLELQFDYVDAWEGFYVIDSSTLPEEIRVAAYEANVSWLSPVSDFKLFFPKSNIEERLTVGTNLVVRIGHVRPGRSHMGLGYTIPGGVIRSVSSN